ncbi:MAG TPA: glycosyltransferase family 4 protein [Solirubrobacteraceae bacterium]|nr:glycosyltransferase family 4 protein [Solirubrobacteraceae bacterium]
MTTSSAGGAEFAAVEMLDALASRGHEVVMLSDLPGIGRDSAVRVAPIAIGPKLSLRTWRRLLIAWPEYVWRLRRALEAQMPYDVVLVHYKKEQLMVPWLPRRLRRQVLWAEWGPVPYPFRSGLPRRAYLHAAQQAGGVMAVSAGTKASVEAVGIPPEKVVVVPNVVDVDTIRFTSHGRDEVRRRLGIPTEAFVVGCISRFHPKKRNDVVVDAVVRLHDPRIHLIMAGAGETEPALRAQARPLDGRAHFVPTPTSDVADVMSAFDVSVFCPSPTEGAPRATILGMLVERPCLSTGAEGVADLIRPEFGAITQPENDPDALAARLSAYVADPGRGERQGKAARAWAERQFAPHAVAAQIEQLLAAA